MCVCVCVCVLVTQPCLTLYHPMGSSTPGSSVHGIKPVLLAVKAQTLNHCTFREFHDHFQFSSVAQSCPTLLQPHGLQHNRLPCPSPTPELTQTCLHLIIDAIQPSHPLLSPSPPTFNLSQHQGFSQWVSSLHQMAKNWSFSFSISASNEYLGLISFRIDWYDVLEVQGTLKSLLQYHSSKASILWCSALSPTLTSINDYWKNQGFDKTELCWQINVSVFKYAV